MQIFLFLALIIAILAGIFAVQNNDVVTLKYFVWHFEQNLGVVLLITLAAGALISFFFSLPSNIQARWGLRQQKKRITELEAQLQDGQNKLTELETRLHEEDIQLAKLQDELAALKPPPPEPEPTPAPVSEPAPSAPASPTKAIASFFKSLRPNSSSTTAAPTAPAPVEPTAVEPQPAEQPTVGPPTVEPTVFEPLADEPTIGEAGVKPDTEEENPA